jgi:hypothetical protein
MSHSIVGVTSLETLATTVKRELLLFDRLAITELGSEGHLPITSPEERNALRRELGWLHDRGLVFRPTFMIPPGLRNDDQFVSLVNATVGAMESIDVLVHSPWWCEMRDQPPEEVFARIEHVLQDRQRVLAQRCRIAAALISHEQGCEAVALLAVPTELPFSTVANRATVLRLVVNELPVIHDDTPWEAIFEFRQDPDTRARVLALRIWASEVAAAKLTPAEVQEKIEHLLNEYRRHLVLRRLKFGAGVLEITVTTVFAALEQLVTFKWGDLAKTLFALRAQRVDLMLAEASAPGRELSFVISADERWSDRLTSR